MKLGEILQKTIQFFKDKKIESARLDAELLLAHALKCERMDLYLKIDKPLSEQEVSICREFVKRRITGEPVAYIVETKGFYGLDFHVEKGVLVPRPETELIVDTVLEFIKRNNIQNPRILDLGTGTGCIGLSLIKILKKENKAASLVAVDKSEVAKKVFSINQENLKLTTSTDSNSAAPNIEFILSDVEELPADFFNQHFDCIVANPPYIAPNDPEVQASVKEHEPALALFTEDDGLKCLKSWSQLTAPLLNSPSIMIFEMGFRQAKLMTTFFEQLHVFKKVSVLQDLSGLDRCIQGLR